MQLLKRLPIVTGLDRVSPSMAWRLVDALYAEDARLAYGAVLLVLAAVLAYARTGSRWMLVWGALSLPLLLGRIALGRAYRRRADRGSPEGWARRCLVGAWLAGALWGAASVVIVVESDPFVQFLLIVCQTAFVAGGAVRNCSVPVVANGQTLLTSVPLLLALLASADPFYRLFAVFVLFHIITTRTIVRAVHEQTMTVLLASEEKIVLADELADKNRQLEELAATDGLTLLLNRRGFDARLAQEWRRSRRDQAPLSLLLLDVDCFKLFNDHYGHQTGDDCLRRVGQGILGASRRPGDTAARYGGEEFAVILPDTDELGARHVAERVRAGVEALAIPHAAYACGCVTASVGAATVWPATGTDDPAGLIGLADEALYRAKHDGRNRVSPALPQNCPAAPGR
jgi:diguanylate cyclase (GGDEF)-like protein